MTNTDTELDWCDIETPPKIPKGWRNGRMQEPLPTDWLERILAGPPGKDPFLEPSVDPPPVTRFPGWIPPELNPDGSQKCTQFYPCHDPDCLRCEDAASHRRAKALMKKMGGKRCFFVTLTENYRTDHVGVQRANLMERFKGLRRLEAWKDNVIGGQYHVHFGTMSNIRAHLHLILEVGNCPVDEFKTGISAEWKRLGGGHQIDVEEVSNGYTRRKEVAYYCTKGLLRQFVPKGTKSNATVEADVLGFVKKIRRAVKGLPKGMPLGSWRGGGNKQAAPVEEEICSEVGVDYTGIYSTTSDISGTDPAPANEPVGPHDRIEKMSDRIEYIPVQGEQRDPNTGIVPNAIDSRPIEDANADKRDSCTAKISQIEAKAKAEGWDWNPKKKRFERNLEYLIRNPIF